MEFDIFTTSSELYLNPHLHLWSLSLDRNCQAKVIGFVFLHQISSEACHLYE